MKTVSESLIAPSGTIGEAIETIDRSGSQIALVTDRDGRLLGTLTDGDIRRALLRGEGLEAPVKKAMRRDFRWLPTTVTEEEALAFMQRETVHQVPVMDEQGRVVKLFLLDELLKPKVLPNQVVIMAGGEGKRLRPYTQDCPKPMLQVGDKPLLEIILEQCIDAGFQDFFFAVNYLKDQITDYFGDGSYWQVRIQYLEEEKPLGTAGSLSLLPERPSESILVLNGDVLTRVDYKRLLNFHHEHDSSATMCVREHNTQIPYGVVRMNDLAVHAMEEKPILSHYVNAGIYLLDPALLELVPSDRFFDMPQLLEKAVAQKHHVSAFPIHEDWLDIGHPETLDKAHEEWGK